MHDQTFQLDRVTLFAKTPNKIFLGHIGSSLVLIYLALPVLPQSVIMAWGLLEVIITPVLLYLLGQRAIKVVANKLPTKSLENQLDALIGFIGISWGLFLAFSLNPDNPAHFGMQMAIAAGASAASVKSLGIFRRAFYLYEIPFMTLVATRLFIIGGDHIWLGILVLVFMIMLSGYAKDTYDGLTDYFNVKLENLDLALKYKHAAIEAEKANRAKSLFLAQANHELRQPIHAIGLLTSCLREEETKPENIEILDNVDSALDSLANLFKSLLGITALDQGTISVRPSTFPIADLLAQTLRQYQEQATQNECSIALVHSGLWVQTDRALLASIVQNLLSNAIKYAPGRKILMGVRRTGPTLSIHVLDQGSGVALEKQDEIFQEFVRVENLHTKHVEGMGLGLSIVSRTAKLLGLHIEFLSELGRGTHVSVQNITHISAPKIQEMVIANSAIENTNLPTIAILDDNTHVARSTHTLLSKWGYDVVQLDASNLASTTASFSMLITDLQLNGSEDGILVAQKLAEMKNQDIPTLIISGALDEEAEKIAKNNGFWFLHKPVHSAELRSVLLTMAAANLR